MKIENLLLRTEGAEVTLSATVGDFELWYKCDSSVGFRRSIDSFVAAALLPAMLRGEDIEVDPEFPVSETLVQNLNELQQIYHCWNKHFRLVTIRCKTVVPEPFAPGRAGTFFSGGVDSLHTFLRRTRELTDVVFINGFDFVMEDAVFTQVVNRIKGTIDQYGIATTAIRTNFWFFEKHHRLCRTASHGSCLASVALALGFSRMFVPASHTYRELAPCGTHPLTDGFWSNGTTTLIHDGASHARVEKIQAIAADQRLLDSMIVCWDNPNSNCGRCSKCLRTATTLRLLGLSSKGLPPMDSPKLLRRIKATYVINIEFIQENLDLAIAKGDTEIARELSAIIRNYHIRRLIITIDRALLLGQLRRLYRRVKEPVGVVGFWTQQLPPAVAEKIR